MYRDFFIEHNFYGRGEYTVDYCGDDVMFNTIEDAKAFIDEIIEYESSGAGDFSKGDAK